MKWLVFGHKGWIGQQVVKIIESKEYIVVTTDIRADDEQNVDKLLQDKGTTIVPLSIFVNKNRLKVKIGVCKGKKLWNKKEDIKSRDLDRDAKREINFR